jgi:hypothetical protein
VKDEANEPSYEQLGDKGNPFSDTKDADPNPDAVGQSLDVESEDEVDRAERHD